MSEESKIKVCVGGESFDGPDFFFCVVTATEDEIVEGLHHEAAKNFIQQHYEVEPTFACDERDSCGSVMSLFDWSSIDGEDPVVVKEWINSCH